MSIFETLAESKIKEAIRNKELENLEGMYKPLVYEDLDIPQELKASYKILKNAGILPEEMQLKKEIYNLEELIRSNILDEEQKNMEQNKLFEKIMKYQEMMKRRK
jgi:hypothetical protein